MALPMPAGVHVTLSNMPRPHAEWRSWTSEGLRVTHAPTSGRVPFYHHPPPPSVGAAYPDSMEVSTLWC